eukprot:scaffold64605_cov18-Tisochrysis_lutea.AAC.2
MGRNPGFQNGGHQGSSAQSHSNPQCPHASESLSDSSRDGTVSIHGRSAPSAHIPVLTAGVLMPKDARHPDGYEALFRAFHLCTLEDIARGNMAASPGSSKRRGKGSGGGVNGSRGSGSGGGAAQRQMQHRWVQTPEMGLQVGKAKDGAQC